MSISNEDVSCVKESRKGLGWKQSKQKGSLRAAEGYRTREVMWLIAAHTTEDTVIFLFMDYWDEYLGATLLEVQEYQKNSSIRSEQCLRELSSVEVSAAEFQKCRKDMNMNWQRFIVKLGWE